MEIPSAARAAALLPAEPRLVGPTLPKPRNRLKARLLALLRPKRASAKGRGACC